MHRHSQRYDVRAGRGSRASRGERKHLTPEARDAAVWPRLWFRFPKLLTPFLLLHLSSANRPPARTLSPRRIYGPAPWSSLANCYWPQTGPKRHDGTGRLAAVATLRPSSAVLPLSSAPPLLNKGQIRLTEHKHLLPESQAAPFNSEIKHCCLHATMNNEAITPDRQATAA